MDKPTGAGAAAGARGRSLRSRRPPPGTAVAEWHIWRGSPELLAHVMRVAERATGGPTKTAIDIAVQDDHEIFSTPQEFLDGVTLEALRNSSRSPR
jgi:hypothetical protein